MIRRLSLALTLVVAVLMTLAPAADAATHSPVLGRKHLFEPYGKGWGTAHPKDVYNGGDPNGHVSSIKWAHWGARTSSGHGLGSQFRPGGGYYAKPVVVQFRATKLGRCSAHGPRAYTVLLVRMQSKPGGRFEKWSHWAGLRTICKRTY